MFLRRLNCVLGGILLLYWSLFLLCPYFTSGPDDFEDENCIPNASISPGLCKIRAGFVMRDFTPSPRQGKVQRSRRVSSECFIRYVRVFIMFLMLSGDIELNPGPLFSPGGLRFAHFNPWSVLGTPKIDKPGLIRDYIQENRIDILALSETWLRPDSLPVTINSITPDDYLCMHVPRSDGRGGGVAFIYRSCFEFHKICLQDFSSFECLTAKLVLKSASYIFTTIYRPPSLSLPAFLDDFSLLLGELSSLSSELFVCGDFNIHVDTRESTALAFLELLVSFNLKQYVDFCTHKGGHTLDLFIGNKESVCKISNFLPTVMSFSDHYAFSCDITIPLVGRPTQGFRKLRMFRHFDSVAFGRDLLSSGINFISDVGLDLFVNVFTSTVRTILDRHAPWKTVKCCNRKNQPFYDRELRDQKRIKSRFESRWRRNKTRANFDAYRTQVQRFSVLLRDAKRRYFRTLIHKQADNSRKLWSVLSKVIGNCGTKILPTSFSEAALANSFSKFFVGKIEKLCAVLNSAENSPDMAHVLTTVTPPSLVEFESVTEEEVKQAIFDMSDATCELDPIPTKYLKTCISAFIKPITIMINKCFDEGQFPSAFKHALVVPLLKKLNLPKEELSSYRPVSHLNFMSKVIEKIVYNKLVRHIQGFSGFAVYQSAYRMFHSTETTLLKVQNDLLLAFKEQKVSALTLLDLSAAFDTVDHAILTDRLQSCFGLGGKALSLLKSYLVGRTQSVQIGDKMSNPVLLLTGVPQGSILGPLLFSLYLAPLESLLLQKEGIRFHFYADDTQIYISFSAKECSLSLSRLSCVLNEVHRWFSFNKLSLNPDKTEYILIGTKQQKAKLTEVSTELSFAGCSLQPTDCVRNLGVLFDENLTMKKHVDKLCHSSFLHIRNLRRVRSSLDLNSAKLLANAIVTSRLDYCNSLLYGIGMGLTKRLQCVQNTLARVVVPSVKRRDHISPILKQLHWLPVRQRIDFKLALLTFKVLQNKQPSYLAEMLVPPTASHLRSSSRGLLSIPSCKMEMARRAFSFSGPKVWNSLPQSIRDCGNLESFKKKLKTYLFPT